jgi:hypothetical protein
MLRGLKGAHVGPPRPARLVSDVPGAVAALHGRDGRGTTLRREIRAQAVRMARCVRGEEAYARAPLIRPAAGGGVRRGRRWAAGVRGPGCWRTKACACSTRVRVCAGVRVVPPAPPGAGGAHRSCEGRGRVLPPVPRVRRSGPPDRLPAPVTQLKKLFSVPKPGNLLQAPLKPASQCMPHGRDAPERWPDFVCGFSGSSNPTRKPGHDWPPEGCC